MLRTPRGGRGSVTAEMAVALPVLIVLLGFALTAVAAVTAQLRCFDAAREGARAAARGESTATVRAVTARTAPTGAVVTVGGGADTVAVGVQVNLHPLGLPLPLPPLRVRAVAAREPGVAQ